MKNRLISWLGGLVPRVLYALRQFELRSLRENANANISTDFIMGDGTSFYLHGKDVSVFIAKGVSFRRFCNIMLFQDADLRIDENVFFNNNCSLNCLKKIEIGQNTLFGEGVRIYDHNHCYTFDTDKGLKVKTDEFNIAPVKIGRNCWIGSNVTILKGVEIGDNVIIGANCLVYRSIPANSIVKHTENLVITPFH